jgi:thioesterase domain-containing protein
MVRQLEEQGHRLDSLILVDVDPLALKTKELPPNTFALRYMLRFLRLEDVTDEDLEAFDGADLAAVLHDLASRNHRDGVSGRQHLAQWVRTIQSRYVDAYAPAPYQPAANVLHVWAQEGAMLHGASTAWQQVLQKQADRVVLPGDHESVIGREHATRLAQTVNDWIAGRLRPE